MHNDVDMGSKKTSLTTYVINTYLKECFNWFPSSKMRIIVTHANKDHYNYFEKGLHGLTDKVDVFILSEKILTWKELVEGESMGSDIFN